jgi:catechol 2,3-dioxygenase-like lactoylglutathione lyase family enzyme
MALDLYMVGLIVADMAKSLEFYRRLGLEIPAGSEGRSHVQIKMGNGLTFFLDANPTRWDPQFVKDEDVAHRTAATRYHSLLEFYLGTQAAVETKYHELTGLGYQGQRPPYANGFGMCFAMIQDPDGNTVLLSGDLAA